MFSHISGFEVSDALPEDTLQLDKGPGIPRRIAAQLQSPLKAAKRFECVAYRMKRHLGSDGWVQRSKGGLVFKEGYLKPESGTSFAENRHLVSGMKSMSQEIQEPTILEKVRLAKSNAQYLVVAVNGDRKTVELISMDGVSHLLDNVPFSAVRRLAEPESDITL